MNFPPSDPNKKGCSRREFLAAALATGLLGCARSAPLRVRGFQGLADLPYFKLDSNGLLRVTVRDLPPIIDMHAHLGSSYMFAPRLDYLRRTPRTHYVLDLDRTGSTLDLDEYVNRSAPEELLREMESEFRDAVTKGSKAAETHTIPNLLAEMDAMNVGKSILLSISPGLPIRDAQTEEWADAVRRCAVPERFVLYGTVHPNDARPAHTLQKQKERFNIRGIKLHPSVGRFHPADPKAMAIYEACEKLDLPVFWHTGNAGIGPEATRDFSNVPGFEKPVAEFPRVRFIFGHAGNREWERAIPIMKRYSNVWVDTHGQGVSALRRIIAEVGPEKLFFGSDWPWYPIAVHLAKILIVTEGDRRVRNLILSENAETFLAK